MKTDNGKTLTLSVAQKYRRAEHSFDLEKFTEIDDAAAEILSKCEEELYLNGLTSLSDRAAASRAAAEAVAAARAAASSVPAKQQATAQ